MAFCNGIRFLINMTHLLMVGCSQSLPENKYMGKIPAKAREHSEERERLIQAQAEVKSMDEHNEIREELSEHDKKWLERIDEYVSSGGLQPTIPFKIEGEFSYTVNEVSFNSNRSIIEVNFLLTQKETFKVRIPRQRITLYFVGLDSNNEPIILSALPLGMDDVREELPAGSELMLKGVWNRDHLRFLEDLAKIQNITQDHYSGLDREKSRVMRRM